MAEAASTIERRAVQVELRVAGRRLEGYAATFGTEARLGPVTEIIMPGAFRASLEGRDILALVDHDPAKVLARTRAGSLRLAEDSRGLHFDAELPNTTAASDALELVRSGNAGGMSFGFTVGRDGERWSGQRRELRAVTLHEISVVSAWPAYQGTQVAARSMLPARLALARRFLETV